MSAATHRSFNPVTRTMFGLPCRALPEIIPIRTCPTGNGAGMEILKRGTGRLHRVTNDFIPIPGVLLQRAIRRPFGIRPRVEIPHPPGIRRLQVPGAAEDAAVVGIRVEVDGMAAVADTAAVECIPAVAAADGMVAAWPTAAATDNLLLHEQWEEGFLTANPG
jgi:hypothetical protein